MNRLQSPLKQQARDFLKSPAHNCALEIGGDSEKQRRKNRVAMVKLFTISVICFTFMCIEVVGGYFSGSIAIISDAAHMLSDLAGFLISFFAVILASYPGTLTYSYGFHRAEVLGAIISIIIIWVLLIFIFIEAVKRIINPDFEIDGFVMLVTACAALCFNIIMMLVLTCWERKSWKKPK